MDRITHDAQLNSLSTDEETVHAPTPVNNEHEEARAEASPKGKRRAKVEKNGKAKDDFETAEAAYGHIGIKDPEVIAFLISNVDNWFTTEKIDAKNVFIRSEIVGTTEHVWESQDQMEEGAETFLEISRRHASTHLRVYKELAPLAERFISARVTPSVIYKLPGAPAEKVEAVLESFEAGRRLTVAETQHFLRQDGDKVAEEGDALRCAAARGRHRVRAGTPCWQ